MVKGKDEGKENSCQKVGPVRFYIRQPGKN